MDDSNGTGRQPDPRVAALVAAACEADALGLRFPLVGDDGRLREARYASLHPTCRACGATITPQLAVAVFDRRAEGWRLCGWECLSHATAPAG